MLKWKKYKFSNIVGPAESLTDILAGMAGKNRVIKYISAPTTVALSIRIYRDAEQIVDYLCSHLTADRQLLIMDLSLSPGQLCKAGFFMLTGTASTPTIQIGYEETD